jgi:hypothetical protein
MDSMIKQALQNINFDEVEKSEEICQDLSAKAGSGLNMIIYDQSSNT